MTNTTNLVGALVVVEGGIKGRGKASKDARAFGLSHFEYAQGLWDCIRAGGLVRR